MSQSSGPRTSWNEDRAALVVWLLIAGALRFFWLSRWSLWGDEAYSYHDALALEQGEWRDSLTGYPLFFLLEWLVLKLAGHGSLELSLRLVPAAAGTLAVGVLFHGSRGFLSRPERHALAALAAFSPWLLFHAQFARFYSLLLCVCAAGTFRFLDALRRRSGRSMALASLWLFLGVLTHPTTLMLLLGLLVTALVARPGGEPLSWRVLWPLLVLIGVLVAGILLNYQAVVDTVGHKILDDRGPGADSVADLAQGIVYNLGLSVSALAALGFPMLWRRRRLLFHAVLLGAGLPFLGLVALALYGTSVEQRYLIPELALLLIPAAVLLAELVERARARLPGATWVIPALVLLPFLPGLVSHYRDGNRHDLRGAAEYIAARLGPRDAVVSENHFLLGHYLPELPAERLLEAPPGHGDGFVPFRALEEESERLFIVLPDQFLDLEGDREAFYRWALHQGRLVQELYTPRFDYHQNRLHVFVVEPGTAERWRPVETGEAGELQPRPRKERGPAGREERGAKGRRSRERAGGETTSGSSDEDG